MEEEQILAVFTETREALRGKTQGLLFHHEDSLEKRDALERGYVLGGKYLRPVLTIMVSRAIKGKDVTGFDLGLMVETLHRTSLVQDDMLDRDMIRRGLKTIHEKWSIARAILTVDRGAGMFFRLLGDFRPTDIMLPAQVSKEIGRTMYDMTTGASAEMLHRDLIEENFVAMQGNKTSSLFRLATIVAAFQYPDPDAHTQLGEYGYHLGLAYQMTDDLIDILTTILSEKPHGDMGDARPSLALIRMNQADPDPVIQRYLKDKLQPDEIVDLARQLNAEGYVLQCVDRINLEIKRAQDNLEDLPPSDSKDMLMDMPAYVVKRIWAELEKWPEGDYMAWPFIRPSWIE